MRVCSHRRRLSFVGGPVVHGLALGGEEDAEQVLRGLLAETGAMLGLIGYRSIGEI
jgi:isopentenyl diphosphate isomerase/L-lactate dehydrogenase-like FMN-dependent dehydrogenase